MAVTVNQIVEIVVAGRSQSQQILNVFHYRTQNPVTFPPAGATIGNLASPFRDLWRANVLPRLSDLYVVEVYRLRSLTGTVVADPGPPPVNQLVQGDAFDLAGTGLDTGSITGEILPTFNAVGVRKVTDRAGRRFRGGARFSSIPEANQANNFLLATEVTAWTTAAFNLFTTAIDSGFLEVFEMCVFSKTSALEATAPQTDLRQYTADVTNAIVNAFMTSQVSRKASAFSPT